MRARTTLCAGLLAVAVVMGAQAQDLQSLLRGAYLVARAPQATVRFRMTIHDAQGEKVRELVVSLTNPTEGGCILARVVQPVSLSGMKYLRIERGTDPIQQWLATSRGVRRLGNSGSNERLFGSDFTVADFARFDSSGYSVARAPDRNTTTWTLSLDPVNGARQRTVMEIDRLTSLILALDTFDAAGKIQRSYRVETVALHADSPYPRQARMSDPAHGTWTLVEVLSIDLATPIPGRIFNPAALE